MTTPPSSNISRRHFIGISALATGAILGAPGFLRAQNAGTKLNVAFVGLGG